MRIVAWPSDIPRGCAYEFLNAALDHAVRHKVGGVARDALGHQRQLVLPQHPNTLHFMEYETKVMTMLLTTSSDSQL